MTKQNLTHKLTRPLVITLMAAVAVPALMAAPNAFAGEKNQIHKKGNTYQSDRARGTRKVQQRSRTNVQRQRNTQQRSRTNVQRQRGAQQHGRNNVQRQRSAQRKNKPAAQRERNWRQDRRLNQGDWSNDAERRRRLARAERTQRANRTQRTQRTNRSQVGTNEHRSNRTQRVNNDRRRSTRRATNRTHRANNNQRRNTRQNTSRTHSGNTYRNNRSQSRSNRHVRRDRRNNRNWQRQSRRSHNYRPNRNTGWSNSHNGYRTNYRSSLGISFNFGQPGYSRYRWAPSRYSYYQPGYMSYSNYQSSTYCDRVLVDGFYNGYPELISVLQCSNPYDGTYIIQGSEQLVNQNLQAGYNAPYNRP
jgi:hypothetical protein